jgi:kumamolisin
MLRAMRRNYILRPRSANPVSLTPRRVAAAYNFPMASATGKGYVGGIIELGGGFNATEVSAYFRSQGLPTPTFVSVNVGRGRNTPDGPDGADGEVQLDMIVAGAVATGAIYRVYFAENTDAGFLAALKQALSECHGVSLSWGGAETDWDAATMNQFEAVIKEARGRGVPLFVASGDTGSRDSTNADTVDFPASSPSAIGCGGTRLALSGSQRASEVTWDDNDTQSATGGGVSQHFPGRDVPDIAGDADPDTGYEVLVDGESMVVGGTSAVAPLMLGLHALLFELNAGKRFDFLNLIVTNPQACYDVTVGDNGGYRAGPGRDQTTGFGVPDGAKLLGALTSGIPAPVPPGPTPPVVTPPVTPTPSKNPLANFPLATIKEWLLHKHNHSHVEATAANALVTWGESVGLTL